MLFFDKKPASEQPWTTKLWVYDLRTNQHFTLKQNPLRRRHLDEFVDSYLRGKPRDERVESERWQSFPYDKLVARDKTGSSTPTPWPGHTAALRPPWSTR